MIRARLPSEPGWRVVQVQLLGNGDLRIWIKPVTEWGISALDTMHFGSLGTHHEVQWHPFTEDGLVDTDNMVRLMPPNETVSDTDAVDYLRQLNKT